MMDAYGLPKLERAAADVPAPDAEAAIGMKKLAILPAPSPPVRDSRPVTNLGRVFGQFAELQQQMAEQVVALEDSVYHQKQDIATAIAQLPELRERINWLIASFYEQSKKDESVQDRLSRHDAALEALLGTVRTMQEQQNRWHSAFDEVIAGLLRAKAAMAPQKP